MCTFVELTARCEGLKLLEWQEAMCGDSEALTVIVTWRFRAGEGGTQKNSRRTQNDLRLDVLGWNDLTAEDIRWRNLRLRIGDEARTKICEAEGATRSASRERSDLARVEKAERKYLEGARHSADSPCESSPRTRTAPVRVRTVGSHVGFRIPGGKRSVPKPPRAAGEKAVNRIRL